MKVHQINIIPTVQKELKPYNYKRVKRLARMSGKSEKEVEDLFVEEYAKLKPQADNKRENKDERYINDAEFDRELVGQLYKSVMKRLGIATDDESLPVSESRVHGFNLEESVKYLLDIGYSEQFVASLKNSPKLALVHYPKYLNQKYKASFERYFERKILNNSYQTEHAVVFYARTLAGFITKLFDAKINPFSKKVIEARTLPISALRSLYKYKFDVLLRYVKAIDVDDFKLKCFRANREMLVMSGKNKLASFTSIGEVVVISKDFDKAIKSIPIGKKLLAGKKLHFSSQKGVDVYVSLEKKEIIIKYRIKIDTQFSVYGIKDLRSWVKEFVVNPCLKPNVSLRAYLKDSL